MTTTERKKTFDCTRCDSNFNTLRMLLQHRHDAGHHRECEVCLKEFPSSLDRHSHRDAGTLHSCDQCDKVYGRKDNLNRHIIESHEDFVLAGLPSGRVSRRKPVVDLNMFLKTSRSVIRIPKDDLCLARALVTDILRQSPNWKNGIRHGQSKQVSLAKRLHARARVSMGRCGIDEVKIFQAVLKGHQIKVVSPAAINAVVYKGPDYEKQIYLCYQDEHFDVITSRAGFLNALYYLLISCDNIHSEQVDEQQQQPDVSSTCKFLLP